MLQILALLVGAFLLAAFYYAVRFPIGAIFPTRRAKLLRKIGPQVTGELQDVQVRFYTQAGGKPRVMLQAIYSYSIKDAHYTATLPTDSNKLAGPGIRLADTKKIVSDIEGAREIELPERLELEDGTVLLSQEKIRQYYLEALRKEREYVELLYDKKSPSISTVRDWS